MKKIYVLIMLAALALCSGCGNAPKDNIKDELSELDKTASASDGEKANDGTIPEKIEYTVEYLDSVSTVNATVDSKGYSSAATYSVDIEEKNDEWLETYAQRFFDGGYKNVKPIFAMTYDELVAERDYWQDNPLDEDGTKYRDACYDLDTYANEDRIISDGLIIETSNTMDYEDDPNCNEQVKSARLRGDSDGKTWELYYDEFRTSTYKSFSLEGVCMGNIIKKESCVSMNETFLPNKTDYDTARYEAERLAKKLMGDDMTVIHSAQCQVNSDGELVNDGYVFVLSPVYNTGTLIYNSYGAMAIDGGAMAEPPLLRVAVNNDGVACFVLLNDYADIHIMSDDVSLLSFDRINENAKEYIKSDMERTGGGYYDIKYIRFGYMLVTYDAEEYALVPAWGYYCDDEATYNPEPGCVFAVCALDGSIIRNGDSGGIMLYYGVTLETRW